MELRWDTTSASLAGVKPRAILIKFSLGILISTNIFAKSIDENSIAFLATVISKW